MFAIAADGTPVERLQDVETGWEGVIHACPGEFGRQAAYRYADELHLTGAGAEETVISASLLRPLEIYASTEVWLAALTLRDGEGGISGDPRTGGALSFVDNAATLDGVHLLDNEAGLGGAFVVDWYSEVTIRNSLVSGNRARNVGNGAAVFRPGGRLVSINTRWGGPEEEKPQNVAIYDEDEELLAIWTPEPGVDFMCAADRAKCWAL